MNSFFKLTSAVVLSLGLSVSGAIAAPTTEKTASSAKAKTTTTKKTSNAKKTPAKKVAAKPKTAPKVAAPVSYLSLNDMDQRYQQWSDRAIASGQSIQGDEKTIVSTLRSLRGYDAKQLGQGWISHMSLQASKNPDFANTVRSEASKNPNLAQDLLKDPRKINGLQGIDKAFLNTLDTVSSDDQSYRWISQSYEANARGQSLPAKEAVNKVTVPSYLNLTPYRSTGASKEPSVMEKTMSLAAIRVLDKDKDAALKPMIDSLAQHRAVTSCLTLAQQNVDQCQAASKGKSDLSFCVAKHNLAEPAQCFAWILP